MTVVGKATVEIAPDASGFGAKTEAEVKKALAAVRANIELTLDSNGLRTKIEAAVKEASAGTQAKIGTDLDTSPLKGRIKAAVEEAAAEASASGGQLNIFDVDPAKLAVEVVAAKEAARVALAAGTQLKLDLDFDGPRLTAEAAAAATAAAEAAKAATAAFGNISIPVEIDPLRAIAEAGATIAALEAIARTGVNIDIGVNVDPTTAVAKANALVDGIAATLPGLDVEMELDDGSVLSFREKVKAVVAAAGIGEKVKVPIEADSAGGGAGPVGDAVGGIFGRAVIRSALKVLAVGAGAQLFTAAISGAEALGSALISATASAGTLASTVAVLPGLLSAAAQAAGVVGLAIGGIKGAFQAFSAMQKAVGKADLGGSGESASAAHAAERAIRDATQGITDAQRSAADAVEAANERVLSSIKAVADAQQNLADTYEESARRVTDAQASVVSATKAVEKAQQALVDTEEQGARRIEAAEQDLTRAHRNAQDAQENLNRARVQAAQDVEDLRRSVARLALTEDEARRRLAEAQTRNALEQKRAQMDLTGVTEETLRALERQASVEDKAAANPAQKAANDLAAAELDLQDAQQKRADTTAKLAQADKTGVEGTDAVVAAKQRLADADTAVADKERDLALLQRDTARSIVDAQDRITEAIAAQSRSQDDLVRTQRDAARAIVDAQDRVTQSYKDQDKAQRDLVRAQEDGARRIADAQQSLADAVQSAADRASAGMSSATGAINAYEAALERLSPAARHFVEFLVSLHPVLKDLQATAGAGLFPGVEEAIRTLLPLVDLLKPVISDTAKALGDLTLSTAKLVTSPGWRSDLVTLGQRNIDIIKGLGRASLSTVDFLRNIAIAAGPLTQHLVDLVENLTALADKAARVGRDNGSLEAFFGRVATRIDKVLTVVGLLGDALFKVFRSALPEGDRYLDSLVRISARFDLLVEKASKSGALTAFFESTRPALEAIVGLVGDLVRGLGGIGGSNFGGFTAFVIQLREELLPTLLRVISTINTGFLTSLVTLATNFVDLAGAILSFNPSLTFFVTLLGGVAEGIAHLLTDIPILSPLIQALVTALGAISVVTAVGGLLRLAESTLFAGKAVQFLTGTEDAEAASQTVLGRSLGVLGRAFAIAGIIYGAKAAVDALGPSIHKLVQETISAKDPVEAFEHNLQRLNKPGLLDSFAVAFKHPVEAIKVDLDLLTGNMKGADKVVDDLMKKIGVNAPDAFRALAEASLATGQKVIDSYKKQGVATGTYESILEDVIQTKAKQGIAESDVQQRIDDATASLKGNNVEMQKHIDKMKAATDQALGLSNASIATEEAIDNLTDSITKNGTNFDIDTAAGRDNKRMLNAVISSIQDEITELGKAADAGQIDNDRKQALLDHLDKLANSGYPGAQTAANNLRSELEAIQPNYFATVTVDTTQAQQALRDLEDQYHLTATAARDAVAAFGAENAAKVSSEIVQDTHLLPREFGGRVERNRAYVVGEKRAELFIPDMNGVVLPTVPDLASLVPFGVSNSIGDVNLMPASSNFDVEGVLERLRALEETLSERLAPLKDLRDSREAEAKAARADAVTKVEQSFSGPLVTIDATFGPGSQAGDILDAMHTIADQRISAALQAVLQAQGAGVGTRNTP